ncbi:aminotransferase class I/II-fold pyridoxal phosphate-dependent enzyme [Ferrimonas balearica]|uniref:aminotransferase class I/II-fold pyridoxal phosphate-dependent enzyme n=1 Tax=Ferrimonas balearica TaxID=44012 RepID=UPI001C9915DA|nr:8-amino-7-oxononanoate synthase [Ferrimonas balearica]MBY5920982.1 8-amino-7-oxononanoate synthase [Ferrimonas balearica]MBY5996333.1 8-amino-7-oxononanoate synthase [Ferrimonas balearica]
MPPVNPFKARAEQQRARRQSDGLWRQRHLIETLDGRLLRFDGREYLQFASNDYLGLAKGGVSEPAQGAGASPLVTGYHPVHRALETRLCELTGYESALLFSSGFAANSAPFSLMAEGDRVLADKLSHASLIDGALASPATLRRFPHNDMGTLARWLEGAASPTLVISESVFSMDGDRAPMADLVRLCQQHGALSWLDDAHGFGVIGECGLGAVEFAKPDLLTLTFGKAMGAQGAALLGPSWLIEALLQQARHYIYSTALSVDQAQRVLTQLNRSAEPEHRARLWANVRHFRQQALAAGLQLTDADSPIVPVITGDNARTLAAAEGLKQKGIWVPAIRPPTVPRGEGRLRVVLNAAHTVSDIDRLVQALVEVLEAGV